MKILRELRERSGLTLRQVEQATQISNSYLSQLETGKINTPSAQSLYVLSKLYAVDVETLLIEAGMVKPLHIEPAIMKPSIESRVEKLEEKPKALEIIYMPFNG